MRCKTCNYPLWNLPGRQCPECGSAFKPSDFEFVPSAVKFCCRRCMQPYYGTTWQGHLMPMAFTCVSCGAPVHMDDTIVLPTEGVDEERTIQGTNPWLDRRRGPVGRFFTAIGHAMVRPTEMARGTPVGASLGQAAVFALLVNFLACAVCFGPNLLMSLASGPAAIGGGAMFLGGAVVAVTIGLWIWGLVAHVILKLTGQTAGGMRQTYLALYYSAGANVLSAFPCVGFLFGWIWWVVSASMMMREFQRVGAGRAALATLVVPLSVVGLLIFGQIWLVSAIVTSTARAGAAARAPGPGAAWSTPGGPGAPGAGTQSPGVVGVRILAGVQSWASDSAGHFPRHPAELVAYRHAPVEDWFIAGSRSSDDGVLIGGASLRALDLAAPGERIDGFRRAIDADLRAREASGTFPAWQRLGDVLLADMGDLTLDRAVPAGLWVVAVCPDPAVNHGGAAEGFTVVAADGVVTQIAPGDADDKIAGQNAARQGVGLPPLTDPRLVGHNAAPPE